MHDIQPLGHCSDEEEGWKRNRRVHGLVMPSGRAGGATHAFLSAFTASASACTHVPLTFTHLLSTSEYPSIHELQMVAFQEHDVQRGTAQRTQPPTTRSKLLMPRLGP